MKLHEYEAKKLFEENGIPVPKGVVTSKTLKKFKGPVVIKAQVLVGGRGKAGGILFADTLKEANQNIKKLIGKKIKGEVVNSVLIEQKLNIKDEYYVGITIDRSEKKPVVMFSTEGGVDIEEVAKNNPEKIVKIHVNPLKEFLPYMARNLLKDVNIPSNKIPKIADIIYKLYNIFVKMDGTLVEINPLVITKDKKIYAADGVLNLDGDSKYRHDFSKFESSSNEENTPFSYVELDGDIAVIGNGAGLTLASMDIVKDYGHEPACFLDIGGGSDKETIEKALELALEKEDVKGVFINILGGITRCDEVAMAIVKAYYEHPEIKFSVRLMGTNEEEGKNILIKNGIPFESSMENAVKKLMDMLK